MSVIAPDQLVGARSPIYITANYSALASSITDITLEIYIWDGARTSKPSSAQYTLFRDVFAGTDVSFDIAPLVAEYLQGTYSSTAITSPAIAEDSTVVWVEVDYDVNYLNKATPAQTVNDTGSKDIFPACSGYHTFAEGANYEVPSTYLNQVERVYIKTTGNEVLPICIGKYGSEDVEEIYYNDGSGDYTIDLTSFHDPTQPEGSIIRFPIGATNLTTYLDSLGYTGNTPDSINSYTLELYNSVEAIDLITVEKVCEPKYTINTIEFVNRYGAWQHLHFFKASQDNFEVTSEQYRRSLGTSSASGFTYDTTDAMYKRYNTNGKKRTTLNTGFVEEDYKEVIKDLMMSERVMLNGSPINVVTNSVVLQKSVNDKTINYTIEVEEAFDTRYV